MTIPNLETLRIDVEGSIARLTLNRPDQRNALSHQALEELQLAADWFDHQQSIKVVVVSGAGDHFCRGADVGGQVNPDLSRRESLDLGRKMTDSIANMRPVTIARLKGLVIGGGFVLALACDLRIAAHDVSMSLPEAMLGWPVPWGCVPRLVREVGPQAAKDIVLACPVLNGSEAFRLGLVRETVPEDRLDAAVDALADEIAKRPAVVLEIIKRQVSEAAEDMASTARSKSDMERMLVALADEEAVRATAEAFPSLLEKYQNA